jgi:hypothetical protein
MKRKGSTKIGSSWLSSIVVGLFFYVLMTELLPFAPNSLVAVGGAVIVFCLVQYALKKLGRGRKW